MAAVIDPQPARRPVGPIKLCASVVTERYAVTWDELTSRRRDIRVAFPRQVLMYLARKCVMRSSTEIGRRLGGRDHSTVLHGVRKIETLIKTDPTFAGEVEALRTAVSERISAQNYL